MWPIWFVILFLIVGFIFFGIVIVNEYQRWIILTLGKYSYTLKPWLKIVIPVFQRVVKIDIREKAVDVPSQEAMTKDNISCNINAVIYYKININEAEKAFLNVRNVDYAMVQFAQTTMRNIIWQFELDELLANRKEASEEIKDIVDTKSDAWWVKVMSVELKDINIPESLKRTIWKQAEAEREKRAKIISAQWELESSENLSKAALQLSQTPWALHLRTLQSINDISSDQSNTTIWMVPIEVLKAFDQVWSWNMSPIDQKQNDAIQKIVKHIKSWT